MDREDSVLYMARSTQSLWLIACLLVCTVVVFVWAPEDWGLVRKVLGGLVMGGWSYFCLFINRILLT